MAWCGDRQRNCDLTIVLFAELSAILPRHADRVLAFFRKTRVVNDPRRNGTMRFDTRDRVGLDTPQHGVIRPVSLADEMQQRKRIKSFCAAKPAQKLGWPTRARRF